MLDKIKVKGNVSIRHYDGNGKLKLAIEQPNLVTTVGLGHIASRLKDASATAMTHMALGTSNTAPSVGDTTLNAEAGRVALDSTTVTTNTVSYVATFGAGVATGTLEEAGLFNDATTGDMLCHTLFASSVVKQASDVVVVTWVLTIG